MNMRHKQSGATLVITMIFLILMSLFAVSAFNSSNGNLKIISNTQARQESIAVGQMAIEKTISTSLFSTQPALVAATPVNVDIDGRGTATYQATLNPQPNCYRTKPIKSIDLNPALDADLSCMKTAVVQQGGIDSPDAAADAGNSMCSNSEWNIGAQVVDLRSGAKIVVNQGVAVRVLETDAVNACL